MSRRAKKPVSLTSALEAAQDSRRLALAREIMEARNAGHADEQPWTLEMTLLVALSNGLEQMEPRYVIR